jgi:CDK inhibitor PHO81
MASRIFYRVCEKASIDSLTFLLKTGLVDCNRLNDINNRTSLHELAIIGRLDVLQVCAEVCQHLTVCRTPRISI